MNEIDDEKDYKEPRFIILFSSKKNLKKLTSDRVLQTDATYRLNWQGFPVWVVGMYFETLCNNLTNHVL